MMFKLTDLDVFYISFDEPNCDVNWARILSAKPDAKRMHGVPGFDRAHRACALASVTDRFVTIDGDNWLNDGGLDHELDDAGLPDVCFSFKSRNVINGLEYGNGGIKVWDRSTLLASQTHERSDSVDFCWDIRYYQVNTVATATVQNRSPYQAWRAGFREGVKMCLIDGKPPTDPMAQIPTIFRSNLSRLNVWCTIGRDVDNGIWAMVGARQALIGMMNRTILHTDINDYAMFQHGWDVIKDHDPETLANDAANILRDDCGFYIPELGPMQSRWFKGVYMNPPRSGLMR